MEDDGWEVVVFRDGPMTRSSFRGGWQEVREVEQCFEREGMVVLR